MDVFRSVLDAHVSCNVWQAQPREHLAGGKLGQVSPGLPVSPSMLWHSLSRTLPRRSIANVARAAFSCCACCSSKGLIGS